MKKASLLKITNPILALALVNQIVSLIIKDYIDYEVFYKIHETGGGILVIGAFLHLLLNWGWVKNNYFKGK